MEHYKIEENIPVTSIYQKRKHKYPFGTLKVSDSFSFDIKLARKIRSASSYYSKISGYKFVVRTNEATNTGRIWRIA